MMLYRKNDAPLDFDFVKVTEQSRDNPVFYVQYAHARASSVLRNVAEALPDLDLAEAALARSDLDRLAMTPRVSPDPPAWHIFRGYRRSCGDGP